MNVNSVDVIVAVVLVAPLVYAAFHYSRRLKGDVADQIVRDLSDRSIRDSHAYDSADAAVPHITGATPSPQTAGDYRHSGS